MRNLFNGLATALAGLGIIGVILVACVPFAVIAFSIYGLYLAFSASIILGLIVFLVEPSAFVIGLVMFFLHKNLALVIMNWMNS